MSSRTPSYIVKSRHGIWYFQYWVPKSANNSFQRQKIVRRSLRTTNRTEALDLARRMYVRIQNVGVDVFMSMKDVKRAEAEHELEKEKYSVGAKVAADIKASGINPESRIALDLYFECTPPHWEDAYYFFLQENSKAQDRPANASDSVRTKSESSHQSENNPLLTDVLQIWLKKEAKDMRKSSFPEYERMTTQFSRIVSEFHKKPNVRLSDLTTEAIRDYRETIIALPKGVKTIGKNIHDLAKQDRPKRRPQTINGIFTNVGLFISWLEKSGYEISPKVGMMLKKREKVKSEDKKQRVPFTPHQLKTIFESEKYKQGKFNHACDYWAPLIALFSGASLSEIPQLLVSDIKNKAGVDYFDINDKDDKQLKNEEGRPRTVPIHPQLKKLDFLGYVENQRQRRQHRLFPDEERTSRYLFGNVSKRYLTFQRNVGVRPSCEKQFLDFHSFRHLVRTELEEAGVEERIIDDIVGHTSRERSIGKKKYSKAERLEDKNKAIKKLHYELNFDAIASWRRCRFIRPAQDGE
jgi:integrase